PSARVAPGPPGRPTLTRHDGTTELAAGARECPRGPARWECPCAAADGHPAAPAGRRAASGSSLAPPAWTTSRFAGQDCRVATTGRLRASCRHLDLRPLPLHRGP